MVVSNKICSVKDSCQNKKTGNMHLSPECERMTRNPGSCWSPISNSLMGIPIVDVFVEGSKEMLVLKEYSEQLL